MTTRTTQQTVEAFFTAFGTGNLDEVKNLFAPTFDLTVHGSNAVPWAGTRHTRDELDDFFAAFAALGPATEYAIDHTIIDGDHAVALGHNAFPVLVTGKTFANSFALHVTVHDGLITGYQMYEDTYAIDQAFTPTN